MLEDGFSGGVDEARQRAKATNARKPRRWRCDCDRESDRELLRADI